MIKPLPDALKILSYCGKKVEEFVSKVLSHVGLVYGMEGSRFITLRFLYLNFGFELVSLLLPFFFQEVPVHETAVRKEAAC